MKLKPIRSFEDLAEAREALAGLIHENDGGERDDEIEIMSLLVEQFERTQSRVEAPDPIAAIKFRMDELGLSPRQLEPFVGSRARVSEVLSGKRSLSIDMIRSLHDGLGIPYASLMSERTRSDVEHLAVSSPAIARLNSLGFQLKEHEVPSFILSSLHQSSSPALLRKTRTQRATLKTDLSALLLWQAAVMNRAAEEPINMRFDRAHLSYDYLRRTAMLSSRNNGPIKAAASLAQKGILLVILPPLPGTFLDGAAMISPSGNPIIGMTLRHDRTDSFWFTLLHELAHIHLHYDALKEDNAVFVDDFEIQSEDVQEQEADETARISLIPDAILSQVHWSASSSQDDIIAVASRARVHVSIAAGRWQRDHQNYRKFARLIERDVVRPFFSHVA